LPKDTTSELAAYLLINPFNNSTLTLFLDEELYSKDEVSLAGYKIGDGIFSTAATFLETLK